MLPIVFLKVINKIPIDTVIHRGDNNQIQFTLVNGDTFASLRSAVITITAINEIVSLFICFVFVCTYAIRNTIQKTTLIGSKK